MFWWAFGPAQRFPILKLVLFFWSSADSEWGQCLLYCKSWTEPMSSWWQYLRATKPAALVWQSSFLKFPAFPVSSPQSKIRQIGWLTPAIASSPSPPLSPVSEWSFLRTPPWSSTSSATSPPSPPRWSPSPSSRWSPPQPCWTVGPQTGRWPPAGFPGRWGWATLSEDTSEGREHKWTCRQVY